jgi:hypothetical protein
LLISIRKLAALDLVFHGRRFMLIEFGGAVALTGALAALSLRSAVTGPGHPVVWEFVLGALLAGIGANYLALLISAISLIRTETAHQEVAAELEHAQQAQYRYGTQQILLAVPFAVAAIAVAQALVGRRRGGT